jgi:hypothetical protein
VPAGEAKKQYWRLSLLIHPDKCDHPRAHDAFQAVAKAAKELQVGGAAGSRPLRGAHSMRVAQKWRWAKARQLLAGRCLRKTPEQTPAPPPPHTHTFPPLPTKKTSPPSLSVQDASLRRAVDARREEAGLRKLAAEYVAAKERERQWRLARGQATATDLEESTGAAAFAALGDRKLMRDSWMTELPAGPTARSTMPMVGGGARGHPCACAFVCGGCFWSGEGCASGWCGVVQGNGEHSRTQ